MRNIEATGTLYGEQITLKQVGKAAAKKLFASGKTIYLQSCNMYPFGMWQSVHAIKYEESDKVSSIELNKRFAANNCDPSPIQDESYQFDYTVTNYSWYNCDSERGKYVTFYANKKDIQP